MPLLLLAQVQRCVLVEVFAEEGCPYCPTALAAAEWLDTAYADTVAVVQYIYPDLFNGSWRLSYYGVPGFPTAWIDGVYEEVGGSSGDTQSVYNRYKNDFLNRAYISSVLSIYVDSSGVRGDSGFVAARVHLDVGMAYQSPKVFAMITHSHQWNDNRWNRFKFMGIISSQYGDSLPVRQAGEEASYLWKFYVKSEWVPESMQVVVFVQDSATKEVLQAVQVPLVSTGVNEGEASGDRVYARGDWLVLELGEPGPVLVEAYDAVGRLERSLRLDLGSGRHGLRLGLGRGVHLLRVETPRETWSLKTLRR